MNESLTEFLNRMGIDEAIPANDEAVEALAEGFQETSYALPAVDTANVAEPQSRSLSAQDVDDILSEMGFEEAPEADAEEIIDEEPADLDDEEDADWDEALRTGRLRPVLGQALQEGRISPETYLAANLANRPLADREELQRAIANTAVSPGAFDPTIIVDAAVDTSVLNSVSVDIDPQHGPFMLDPQGERIYLSAGVSAQMESSEDLQEDDDGLDEEDSEDSQEDAIPENSPTLMLDDSTSRFSGAEWFQEVQNKTILFGGAGGIGSFACFQLARLKPNAMYIYDDDVVEEANMSGQMYPRSDVGERKVRALRNIITQYTNTGCIYVHSKRFTSNTIGTNVMMCGFDNMEARRTFFDVWKAHVAGKPEEEKHKCLYLDGRLSIDVLQVFCLTGDDVYNINRYEQDYLFSDSEAEETICSLKQTTYMACMIGSFMVNLFTNWCANLTDPVVPYDLPFFTEYDAQNMLFKTLK